jgi:hypothetical protein
MALKEVRQVSDRFVGGRVSEALLRMRRAVSQTKETSGFYASNINTRMQIGEVYY